jgi:hypothetical protein
MGNPRLVSGDFFCRTVSRILFLPALRPKDDNHIPRMHIAMHLMRLIPRYFTFVKRREIRSCTEVRILPLHFPVAKEFTRQSRALRLSIDGASAFRLGRHCSHLWVLSWQALPATCLLYESDRLRCLHKAGVRTFLTSSCERARLSSTAEGMIANASGLDK